MINLFEDLEYVQAYLDNLLCLACNSCYDYLNKLDVSLERLE